MLYIVSAQLKNWGTYRTKIEANSPEEADRKYREAAGAKFPLLTEPDVRTEAQEEERKLRRSAWEDNDEN